MPALCLHTKKTIIKFSLELLCRNALLYTHVAHLSRLHDIRTVSEFLQAALDSQLFVPSVTPDKHFV